MKNLSFIITVVFIIGILMGLYLQTSIVFLLCIILAIFSIFTVKNKKLKNKIIIFIFIFIFFISLSYTKIKKYQFEEKYSNIKYCSAELKIINLESTNDYYNTYKAKIIRFEDTDNNQNDDNNTKNNNDVNDDKNKNRNKSNNKNNSQNKNHFLNTYKNDCILVKIKKENSKNFNKKLNTNSKIELGDTIYITGEIINPDIQRNYKGFNYKQYLCSKNIYTTIKSDNFKIINKNKNIMYYIKNFIIKSFEDNFNETDASICLASIIGYKAGISDDVKDILKECNLLHLLAISGMHVGIIITIINIISKKFSKKGTKIFNIIALTFYLMLVGNIPSVVRACLMHIFIITGSLVYRKSSAIPNLAISALILLIINPFVITNNGFIFSYTGTLSILLFYKNIESGIEYLSLKFSKLSKDSLPKEENLLNKIVNGARKYIFEVICISISANILILPISIYYFNSVSITFLISNILAQPILTLIVILSGIHIFLSFMNIKFFSFFSLIIQFTINIFLKITDIISRLPCSKIILTTPKIYIIIVIYVCIFYLKILYENNKLTKIFFKEKLLILKKYIINYKRKSIVFLSLLILTFSVFLYYHTNIGLKIFFIDVGQGDSTLIITQNGTKILIDGGGNTNSDFNIWEKTVLPYLLDRNIRYLDYVFISHFDTDHVRFYIIFIKTSKSKKYYYWKAI